MFNEICFVNESVVQSAALGVNIARYRAIHRLEQAFNLCNIYKIKFKIDNFGSSNLLMR